MELGVSLRIHRVKFFLADLVLPELFQTFNDVNISFMIRFGCRYFFLRLNRG
jgi:hypothetical protein